MAWWTPNNCTLWHARLFQFIEAWHVDATGSKQGLTRSSWRKFCTETEITPTVGIGTTGWRVGGARPGERRVGGRDAQWRPTLKTLSPAYTTRWDDLLRVR